MIDVGVVGGGSAGAAAALFLARAGHRVTVYERVPDPQPVGAGIVLQPTGQAVLARLGLEGTVLAKTARIDELLCATSTGRTVVKLRYDDLGRPDLFGLGTHRGALFETLFDAARAECEVRCGVGIDALVRERRRISRRGSATVGDDRVSLVDDGGGRHGPHDLIVVADGAKSRLRDDVPIPMRIRPYAWGAIWFLAQDPQQLFRDQLLQIVRSNARMLGFLPTGLGPGAAVEPVTSVYWSVRGDHVEALRRRGPAAWKDDVREVVAKIPGLAEKTEVLLAQITDMDQLLYAQYHDVEMRPWAHERVVFLGDAAHAMSPQLGQGCNLALVDALVLAECVHAFASSGPLGIDRALDAYSLRRARHLGVYQQATRWLTPFFQGDVDALADLRDVFMPLAMKLPFAKRMMAQSMAGMLGGWLGAEHALPERESEVPGRLSLAASPAR